MTVYNRRNALVGYMTLKAASRALERRRRRQRFGRNLKVALFVTLAIVSAGVLAGVLAIALRHRSGDTADSAFESDAEIVGEYVTAPEPAPAT